MSEKDILLSIVWDGLFLWKRENEPPDFSRFCYLCSDRANDIIELFRDNSLNEKSMQAEEYEGKTYFKIYTQESKIDSIKDLLSEHPSACNWERMFYSVDEEKKESSLKVIFRIP
jgi:hypothetical protein